MIALLLCSIPSAIIGALCWYADETAARQNATIRAMLGDEQ